MSVRAADKLHGMGAVAKSVSVVVAVVAFVGYLAPAQAAGHDESGSSRYGKAALGCEAPYPLNHKERALTKELHRRLVAAGFAAAVEAGDLAVSLVDLSGEEPVYAGVNDTTMMYAASLPKIAIVLAVAQAVRENRLRWSDELDRRLRLAINRSSNRDAAWSAMQVGAPYIERVLRRPGLCFYGNKYGGLWLGRPYTRRLPDRRDPVARLNHGATARQTARFYTLLAKGLLVDRETNEHILSLMSPPAITHKFVRGLVNRSVRFLARKSGSWWHFHSDSALIEHDGLRYAVVALSRNVKKKRHRLEEIARMADDLILERHGKRRRSARLGRAAQPGQILLTAVR